MTYEVAAKLMLYGVIVAEEVLLVVCFHRFWRASGEKLFAFFTAGFVVMAVHRISLGFAVARGVNLEQQVAVFVLRLLSYVLIFIGVLAKNLQRRSTATTA